MSIYKGTQPLAVLPTNLINTVNEQQALKADKLYQGFITISDGNVVLQDNCSVYFQEVNSATTFTFDTSNLTKYTNNFCTFEIILLVNTASPLTFPSNLNWLGGQAPDVSGTGVFMFSFRKRANWTNWRGCLEGKD